MYQNSDELFTLEKDVVFRSVCPENPTGGKGAGGMAEIPEDMAETHPARDLGKTFKVRPNVRIEPHEVFTMAEIEGEGVINHIWLTTSGNIYRNFILRVYWDGCKTPSVECPVGDFFFTGFNGGFQPINSMCVAVNPGSGFNCFWKMPFRKSARITLENAGPEMMGLYYQVDYELRKVPEDAGYFHAQFRRTNPLGYKEDYVILDRIDGRGKYVGTFVSYAPKSDGWWGEGEVKMFLDGDDKYPTYCGTGTEDYFLGSYNFEDKRTRTYYTYTGLYSGFYEVPREDMYRSQLRLGMYRIHRTDPVHFAQNIRITMQSLGWMSQHRFHPQRDDISSVAYFYLDHPTQQPAPRLTPDLLEIV